MLELFSWVQNNRMLNWEDAYYDGSQYPDKKWFIATAGTSSQGPYSHDPLGLAMAKMSYQVYSLGEGYDTYHRTNYVLLLHISVLPC